MPVADGRTKSLRFGNGAALRGAGRTVQLFWGQSDIVCNNESMVAELGGWPNEHTDYRAVVRVVDGLSERSLRADVRFSPPGWLTIRSLEDLADVLVVPASQVLEVTLEEQS
jgi:hypothetical protein